jgi:hypothetical protein
MSYLDLLREEFPETPSPRELPKLTKATSDNSSELPKLTKATSVGFVSTHGVGVSEIKHADAVAAEAKHKPRLSPELETLVRKAAVHYEALPGELELMLDAARDDPNGARIYYLGLAAELGWKTSPADGQDSRR